MPPGGEAPGECPREGPREGPVVGDGPAPCGGTNEFSEPLAPSIWNCSLSGSARAAGASLNRRLMVVPFGSVSMSAAETWVWIVVCAVSITAANRSWPLPSVTSNRFTTPPCSVTVAPGTTPPDESLTEPETAPVVSCADARGAPPARSRTQIRPLLIDTLLPGGVIHAPHVRPVALCVHGVC